MLLLVFFASNLLKAQVSGHGSGTWGGATTISSFINYFDDVRGEVDLVIGSGTSVTLKLNATHYGGSYSNTFSNGDMALLIQMKGGTIGRHQNVILTGSGTSWTATAVAGSILTYTPSGGSGTANMVQLIKIRQYPSLTVTGGIITCHQWDQHTGGILCFVVQNNLNISGGVLDVGGLGYTSTEAGVTYGIGGTGSPKVSSYGSPFSSTPPVSSAFICGVGNTPVANLGTSGTQAQLIPMPTLGSINVGPQTAYGGSNFHLILRMGDPGYWVTPAAPPYGGGMGSQGGGYGGGGGNGTLACATTGLPGSAGTDGGPGGIAGTGGNGGGAIEIKVGGNVNITTTNKVFGAWGANGGDGGYGSDGGLGGPGGAGGGACCIPPGTLNSPGGNGGYGDNGAAGTGGDGGNGGHPGYIWIAANGSYNFITTIRADNFNVKGGKGGYGGYNGDGGGNLTWMGAVTNPCTGLTCTTGGVGNCGNYYCDADAVMCILNTVLAGSVPAPNGVIFKNGLGLPIGGFDATNTPNYIWATDGCNTYYSFGSPGPGSTVSDCINLFSIMGHIIPSPATLTPVIYPGIITTGSCGPITTPLNINFNDLSIITLISYTHNPSLGKWQFQDMTDPGNPTWVIQPCPINTGTGGTLKGRNTTGIPELAPNRNRARDGVAAPDGTVDQGSSTDNGVIEDPATFKRGSTGVANSSSTNLLGANVYPNPATNDVWIQMESTTNSDLNIKIMDMSGKLVLELKEKLSVGNNQLHINSSVLSKGMYILQLNSNQKTSVFNLSIE